MPLIRIVYRANKYGFDYVTGDHLDTLIAQDGISHFYRPSEGRWIDVKIDPVRGSGGGYQGPERRGKNDKHGSIGEKRGLNSGRPRSDWLEGLWQEVESHDALG